MNTPHAAMLLSIVIPFRDEAEFVSRLQLTANDWEELGVEVVLVDDGSRDSGAEDARRLIPGARLLRLAGVGTGAAFLAGLREASGDFVMLLPIDCELKRAGLEELLTELTRQSAEVYVFPKYYMGEASMRAYAFLQNEVLLRRLRLASWTNALVLRRTTDLACLERAAQKSFLVDLELSRLLAARSWRVLRSALGVSPRRYRQDGRLRRVWINGLIVLLWFFRIVDHDRLLAMYRRKK
jgi:glycosyltransferase involved in cell wall biosynthesis